MMNNVNKKNQLWETIFSILFSLIMTLVFVFNNINIIEEKKYVSDNNMYVDDFYMEGTQNNNTLGTVKAMAVNFTLIPEIVIETGKENVIVEMGNSYNIIDGVSAIDNYGENITNKITYISSPVLNLNKVGTYTITYLVTGSNFYKAIPKTKVITVSDTVVLSTTVEYSNTSLGTEPVDVTILANKNIIMDDYSWNCEINQCTKTYNENTNESVVVKDLSGNTVSIDIEITNIDKTKPTGNVTNSPNGLTNQNVTVTLTSNEAIQTPTGWTKIDDKTYTKVYENNKSEVVNIIDLAGNTNTVNVNVSNIDKEAPVITINGDSLYYHEAKTIYNDLGATAFDDIDGIVTVISEGSINVNLTDTYYITYIGIDTAGNEVRMTRTIIVRDTTSPTITVDKASVEIALGTSYNLLDGVSASDTYDGDITNEITITSTPEFNKDIAGTYIISYEVSDSSGNSTVALLDKVLRVIDPDVSKRRPMVVFIDDDGASQFIDFWEDILRDTGISVSCSVITGNVGISGYMTWDQIKYLNQTYGVEILNHSHSHFDLTSFTVNNLRTEFLTSQKIFRDNGFMSDILVYPFGAYNAEIIEIAEEFFRSAVTTFPERINVPIFNKYEIYRYSIGIDVIEQTWGTIKSQLDNALAQDGLLVYMNHSHDPTSTDDLKLLIRKIIDYSREIGVDIVSMEEALNSMNDY